MTSSLKIQWGLLWKPNMYNILGTVKTQTQRSELSQHLKMRQLRLYMSQKKKKNVDALSVGSKSHIKHVNWFLHEPAILKSTKRKWFIPLCLWFRDMVSTFSYFCFLFLLANCLESHTCHILAKWNIFLHCKELMAQKPCG